MRAIIVWSKETSASTFNVTQKCAYSDDLLGWQVREGYVYTSTIGKMVRGEPLNTAYSDDYDYTEISYEELTVQVSLGIISSKSFPQVNEPCRCFIY